MWKLYFSDNVGDPKMFGRNAKDDQGDDGGGGRHYLRKKRWKRRQSQSLKRREGKRSNAEEVFPIFNFILTICDIVFLEGWRGGGRGRGGQKTRGAKWKPSFDDGKEDDEEDESREDDKEDNFWLKPFWWDQAEFSSNTDFTTVSAAHAWCLCISACFQLRILIKD